MSGDDCGASDRVDGPARGRWYQFSLSSLLCVVLLIAAGAGGLHALRTQRELRAARQQLAEASSQLERASAMLEASQADARATKDEQAQLQSKLTAAELRRDALGRETDRLSTKLSDVQRDPTRWLAHEEQQLVRGLRELQAKREPAAAAAQRRDLFRAKDQEARRRFLTRLDQRSDYLYSGGLDEVVKYLVEQSKVPIVIQAEDLAEAQIPRIRNTKVHCENATVEQALSQAIVWASTNFVRSLQDPRLELVYVLSAPDQAGPAGLIVTTRKRAAQRGWLPETFVPAGSAVAQ